MTLPRTFSASTLGHAWEISVMGLLHDPSALLVDSVTGGPARELECVQLIVEDPQREPRVSSHYVLPELIEDYSSLFTPYASTRPKDAATIADRIYGWRSGKRTIDQVDAVISELRDRPHSRRAVMSFWDPAEDLVALDGTPLGHCMAWMSVREEALNMALVSRSVDAWLGAVPNMIAFTGLMHTVAAKLDLAIGSYTQFIFSYHIYVRDLPSARRALG